MGEWAEPSSPPSSSELLQVPSLQVAHLRGKTGGLHSESAPVDPGLQEVSFGSEPPDLVAQLCVLLIQSSIALHLCKICPIIKLCDSRVEDVELVGVTNEVAQEPGRE
jgi:hypothetical protein